MLSVPYQEDLPLNQFVYPINPQAKQPEAFVKWSLTAQEPANFALKAIARNPDRWLEEWTNEMLR